MMQKQLELFPKTEEEELREQLFGVKQALENLRRGLFKRHSILAENATTLQVKVDDIEKQMRVINRYLKEYFDAGNEKQSGNLF